jgi:hypothetical protein
MPLTQVISWPDTSIALSSSRRPATHQAHGFVHRHHAAHAREHPLHEEVVIVAAHREAGVAHLTSPRSRSRAANAVLAMPTSVEPPGNKRVPIAQAEGLHNQT